MKNWCTALATLIVLAGCSATTLPLPDKNTNWLKACDADAVCGSKLACVCGRCSKACSDDLECGGLHPNATCAAQPQAACGNEPPMESVCMLACERNSDCDRYATGLVCSGGSCVKAPEAPDASAPSEVCTPGEVTNTVCEAKCSTATKAAFATCKADGHFGPCTCPDPECGPGINCALGYDCFEERCVAVRAACGGGFCEPGFRCADDVCYQILADNQSSPVALAVDDREVFFANGGTYDATRGSFNFDSNVMAVGITGGPVRRVAEDLNQISYMLIDSTRAYWLNERDGVRFQIMSAPLRNGTPNAIWNTGTAVSDLVQDEQFLYWLTAEPSGTAELKRARKDGTGTVTTVYTLVAKSHALALQGTTLYWGGSETGLWRGDTNGSQAMFEGTSRYLSGMVRLFANDEVIGWYKRWNGNNGFFWWMPNAPFMRGGGIGSYDVKSLALDGLYLYFLDCVEGNCSLNRVGIDDGQLPALLWRSDKLDNTSLIAVRGNYIYLTTGTAHPGKEQVLRIAKP